jgi:hypothetical protein
MSNNYKNLLKQLENLKRLEKESKLPKTKKMPANLQKALKESEKGPKGFSILTEEERNTWQMIYNEAGPDAFKEMNINVIIDPLTKYSRKPKVTLVQEANAQNKYRAYLASLDTGNDTSTVASDPRSVTPPPPKKPALLTNFIKENYFKGGRKHTRKHPRRMGCRFTRKH